MDAIALMGKQSVGLDRPKDYIDWAIQKMLEGVESEHLPILASIDLERPIDSVEVRECFARVVHELGIETPPTDECVNKFTSFLCGELVSGAHDYRAGVRELGRMYSAGDYANVLLAGWFYLDDDLDLLATGYLPAFNFGLTRKKQEEFVKKFARQHQILSDLELPDDFADHRNCIECGLVSIPNFDQCPRCRSRSLMDMTSFDSRQAWLDQREFD